MQMERVVQLASSLPDGSDTRTKLTGTLIKSLWDSLQHPPLSYLGDENEYRTADGSNNVRRVESEYGRYGPLTDSNLPSRTSCIQSLEWQERLMQEVSSQ